MTLFTQLLINYGSVFYHHILYLIDGLHNNDINVLINDI